MQNRYTADLGDFGKYGLLKALCQTQDKDEESNLRLGVVWYLVPDENHNDDGKHIKYLEPSYKNRNQFRNCDRDLYDALAEIIQTKERNVSNIRKSNIFPIHTAFYEEYLTFDNIPSNGVNARKKRMDHRKRWVNKALISTGDCDLIFVDPDNGLEVKSTERQHKLGPKYAYFDELLPKLKREQSLVIYHHISRQGSADDQINVRFQQINECLDGDDYAFALRYHRGTSRVFFVIPSEDHRNILIDRAKGFVQGPWSQHFTLITPDNTHPHH
ncbi:MAG: hypothetical protein E4G94_06815 [ANME-2 cluster archaeon]|nr:MAG: hypothetical protein E4G94_06815 [ANME-2 cluster archaeon]